jgi:hypothetical protein
MTPVICLHSYILISAVSMALMQLVVAFSLDTFHQPEYLPSTTSPSMDSDDHLFQCFDNMLSLEESAYLSHSDGHLIQHFDNVLSLQESTSSSHLISGDHLIQLFDTVLSSEEPGSLSRFENLHTPEGSESQPSLPASPSRASTECSDKKSQYIQDLSFHRATSDINEETLATNAITEWRPPPIYDVMDSASEFKIIFHLHIHFLLVV